MLVVRPIAISDYEALHTCAVESGHGFTSLPVNEELLTNRIKHSEYSFTKPDVNQPGDEGYLMVGFDSETGEVAGPQALKLPWAGIFRFTLTTSAPSCTRRQNWASTMWLSC